MLSCRTRACGSQIAARRDLVEDRREQDRRKNHGKDFEDQDMGDPAATGLKPIMGFPFVQGHPRSDSAAGHIKPTPKRTEGQISTDIWPSVQKHKLFNNPFIMQAHNQE